MFATAEDTKEKVFFMGSVKAYFEKYCSTNKSLGTKLKEAGEGSATSGGVLEYGGLCFTEYKVGKETRFFGNYFKGCFCVYLIALQHREGVYTGITWDGKDTFAAKYASKELNPDDVAEKAYYAAVKESSHLMNTMNAPEPLYD